MTGAGEITVDIYPNPAEAKSCYLSLRVEFPKAYPKQPPNITIEDFPETYNQYMKRIRDKIIRELAEYKDSSEPYVFNIIISLKDELKTIAENLRQNTLWEEREEQKSALEQKKLGKTNHLSRCHFHPFFAIRIYEDFE